MLCVPLIPTAGRSLTSKRGTLWICPSGLGGGVTFYDYHKAFSAHAASLLSDHHIKTDWSYWDQNIFNQFMAAGLGIRSDRTPRVEIVPENIRLDVVQGRDINLAAFLIPGYKTESEAGSGASWLMVWQSH